MGVRGRGSGGELVTIPFLQFPGDTVAWSRMNDPFTYLADGSTGTGSVVTGTTLGQLIISNPSQEDEGEYVYWVSRDGAPLEPITSTTLYIDRQVPDVVHAPVSREICTDGTVTFRVDAIGAKTYRWAWNGTELQDGILPTGGGADVLVAGAGTSEITLIGVTPEAAGEITCQIFGMPDENARSAEIFPVDLTVSDNTLPPAIVTQPAALTTVEVGASVELVTEALASDAFSIQTYQWRKDGTPIFGDGRVFGTNFPDLLIENVELSDAGVYDCVVTQACGTVTSLPAVLTVSCPADTNGDGSVDPSDFNAWVLAYNSQSPACDQNGDGLCTPADFKAWVLNFNAGC